MFNNPISVEKTMTRWSFIKRYYLRHKVIYTTLIIISFVGTLFNIVLPYILKKIVDSLTNSASFGSNINEVIKWGAFLVIAQAFSYGLWRVWGYVVGYWTPKTKVEIQKDMYKYLYDHSYRYFSDNFVGNLAVRITNSARIFISLFKNISSSLLYAVVSSLGGIVIFSLTNIWLGVVLFLWLFVFYTGFYFLAKKKEKYASDVSNAHAETAGKITDSASNILSVKIFTGFRHESKYLDRYMGDEMKKERKSLKFSENVNSLRSLITISLYGVSFVLGIWLWWRKIITPGDLVLIFAVIDEMAYCMEDVFYEMIDFFDSWGDLGANIDAIYSPHEICDVDNAKELSVSKGEITFDKVNFGYDDDKKIFENLDFVIKSKEKVALVGRSGAGKSTFINILLRFYDLKSGWVLIDGQDISRVQQESLRSKISVVPQDSVLFHRSILENICYGYPEASREEVIKAAKKAYAHDFIISFPNGYDSLVGERGIKLSGGQRQRIIIARAILANRPILILDEATSSLDSESELYIQKALSELMRNKTVIAIAHRLSTIREMDRILVFEDGRIVEEDHHDNLIHKKGLYAKLWSLQTGKDKEDIS